MKPRLGTASLNKQGFYFPQIPKRGSLIQSGLVLPLGTEKVNLTGLISLFFQVEGCANNPSNFYWKTLPESTPNRLHQAKIKVLAA